MDGFGVFTNVLYETFCVAIWLQPQCRNCLLCETFSFCKWSIRMLVLETKDRWSLCYTMNSKIGSKAGRNFFAAHCCCTVDYFLLLGTLSGYFWQQVLGVSGKGAAQTSWRFFPGSSQCRFALRSVDATLVGYTYVYSMIWLSTPVTSWETYFGAQKLFGVNNKI